MLGFWPGKGSGDIEVEGARLRRRWLGAEEGIKVGSAEVFSKIVVTLVVPG